MACRCRRRFLPGWANTWSTTTARSPRSASSRAPLCTRRTVSDVAQDKETFLGRWSRLKQEEKKLPEKKPDAGEAPALPPVDKLTPESDFTGFMHPKVE